MIAGVDYPGLAVVFYCHDGNKHFALGKRSTNTRAYHGHWDGGGGQIEFGETVQEAIDRELLEEFGCTGKVEYEFPASTRVFEKDGKTNHWVVLRFLIRVNHEDVRNNEPRSIDEVSWFTLDNLPEPLLPGLAEDLKDHKELLLKLT